ncbi:Glucoamylase [Caenispirillum salinarum AK4]|uniref:Glucoamylase n=1 Tax=Caenispirillum salinarum AK4 TaxID=1238182 RepID=K9H3Z3_9PROT|nr:glycoside hydrolase family 15 protein [Caenispirillum salinarum]EKV31774.1 Glucoamylase [Caenispirillum salinarum AK4]
MPEPEPEPAAGDWPNIDDYAIIGDCRTAALVDRRGGVEWMCLPAISSPSVFGAMLDREAGGVFFVRPVAVERVERDYMPGTNILTTTFHTAGGGCMRLTDCMPLMPDPQRRLQLEPTRELLRKAEGLEGRVEMEVLYQPRPAYGRVAARLKKRGGLGWAFRHGGHLYNLLSDVALEPSDSRDRLTGRFTLEAGQVHWFSFTYANEIGVVTSLGRAAEKRIAQTARWWREWSVRCRYDGPHETLVKRSMLTLKLMTYAPSGALIGAPTCSLPETIGGRRNWDYRYCWPRDATLTLRALIKMGYDGEARSFIAWLLHSTRLTRPNLLPMYDIYGRKVPAEKTLDHLSGFRGSAPVRIGNGARDQLQLDIYGGVILAVADFLQGGGELAKQEWSLILDFAEVIRKRWREPDNGIWEMRGGRKHYTYSKVMCWVGLDCLVRLCEEDGLDLDVGPYRRERDAIRADIEEHGWNEEVQSYVGVYDSDIADASLLLMGRLGYQDPNHPRITGTLRYIGDQLAENGFLRRYRTGVDHDSSEEGAFAMCSFWRADLLALRGEVNAAERLFDHLLGATNDVGLMAEEIDPKTGRQLGNFPQAFTHIGLITAAMELARAEREKAGEHEHEKREEEETA